MKGEKMRLGELTLSQVKKTYNSPEISFDCNSWEPLVKVDGETFNLNQEICPQCYAPVVDNRCTAQCDRSERL